MKENRQNAQRLREYAKLRAVYGKLRVPLTENIGSGRLDWVLNNKLTGSTASSTTTMWR